MEEGRLITLEEVADRLQVSIPTVRRWIKGGRLPATKPGGTYRVRAGDLEDFLARHMAPPKDGAPRESGQAEPPDNVEEQAWAWATQLTRRADEGQRILDAAIADPESTYMGEAAAWADDVAALFTVMEKHAGAARERDRVRAAERRLREVLASVGRFFGQEIHEHDDERWEQRARFMRQHAEARPRPDAAGEADEGTRTA